MTILYFLLYLWVIFALLDPDPDPDPVSIVVTKSPKNMAISCILPNSENGGKTHEPESQPLRPHPPTAFSSPTFPNVVFVYLPKIS
jgi:hypothetical protein